MSNSVKGISHAEGQFLRLRSTPSAAVRHFNLLRFTLCFLLEQSRRPELHKTNKSMLAQQRMKGAFAKNLECLCALHSCSACQLRFPSHRTKRPSIAQTMSSLTQTAKLSPSMNNTAVSLKLYLEAKSLFTYQLHGGKSSRVGEHFCLSIVGHK